MTELKGSENRLLTVKDDGGSFRINLQERLSIKKTFEPSDIAVRNHQRAREEVTTRTRGKANCLCQYESGDEVIRNRKRKALPPDALIIPRKVTMLDE